jgi:uncharacterized phiE125 gp8 family phage protein
VAATDIFTLAQAKKQLNIDAADTASDDELSGVYIPAVTAVIENNVGKVINRSVTEVFDGGRAVLLLTSIPVVSITSVTEAGSVLDPAGYVVDKNSGVLTRVSGVSAIACLPGIQSVSVLYVAGQAADVTQVAGNVRLAGLIILQHMWETQRPAGGGPFSQGQDDYDPRYSYSIPRRALELLGEPIGGFA